MSLTLTVLRRGHLIGGMACRLCSVQFDNSYATGGESLSPDQVGLTQILAAINGKAGSGDAGLQFQYDPVNKKLLAYRSGAGGIQTYTQGDIKGSANTDAVGAGAYVTIPTNGNLIVTLAASNNTTAFTIALQPDIPRNVCVLVKDNSGGSVDGNAADYAIVGTFRGTAQTETISFSAANVATMANGNIAVKYGVKPFDSITSITPSAAQPAGFQCGVGPGSKLGLPWDLATPAEGDIIKLFKNATNLAITGLYSSNKTVNFGTLADGDDISVEANTAGGFVETASAADLSTVIPNILFIG